MTLEMLMNREIFDFVQLVTQNTYRSYTTLNPTQFPQIL